MGRKRKQPRRIVTFNLNVGLADAIDQLPIRNRSEWANEVLREVIDGTRDRQELKTATGRREIAIEAEDALLDQLLANPARLTSMLLTSLGDYGLLDERMKGRFSIEEQLLILRNELVGGRFKDITETETYEERVAGLKDRLARGDL